MLLINPKAQSVWVKHEASGAHFLIRPMDSAAQNALEARALKKDGSSLDWERYVQLFAAEHLEDWAGVGDAGAPLPCTPEHRARLARAHQNTVMAWLIREARSLDHFRAEELDAAKNA